jgi:serine/threonine protein kinase
MPESSADRDPLDRLAEEFVARFRAGERPSLTDFAQRLPERADEVRELFPALVEMEQLKPAAADSTGDFTPALEPSDPRHVGEFRIVRAVGRGGMGVVYEAVQESLGRHVALKLLPAEALADPRRLERFRREAKAAARLHHTNIVSVFGTGEADGRHYYAMQFIDGHPLDAVIKELRRLKQRSDAEKPPRAASGVAEALLSGAFEQSAPPSGASRSDPPAGAPARAATSSSPAFSGSLSDGGRPYWEAVARIGIQAADALAYAHAQGILHRDIKPANLLLDLRGTLWVTDFGLAKAADADDLTHSGDVVGTLRYLAPERFEGRADERSDVYALGLTLYELLTLRPAFVADNRAKLVEQVLAASPPRPRSVNPSVPRDLETVVLKATARDPAARYASAGELAEDLRRYLEDRPIRARRASGTEQAWRWCRRNPAVASLLTAVLLVFAVGAALSLFFGFGEREQAREAEAARKRATDEADRVRAEQEHARRLLYVSRMNLAAVCLADENIPRLRELLDEMIPPPGETDLRGWEWHYLNNLTRVPSRHEFVVAGTQAMPSVDGRWLTVLRPDGENGENCLFDVWDVPAGRRVATLPRPGSPPVPRLPGGFPEAEVSPDGSVLAVGFRMLDRKWQPLRLWRIDTGEPLSGPAELPLDHQYGNPFVLGAGGAWVAWDEPLSGPALAPGGLARYGPDGVEKTVARWELSTGKVTRTTFRSRCGSGASAELTADGRTAFCGCASYSQSFLSGRTSSEAEQRVEAWDLTADPPRLRWPPVGLPRLRPSDNAFVQTRLSAGRTCLAVLHHHNELTIYRLADGQALWRATAGDWRPSTAATLVGVSDDGGRVLMHANSVCFVLQRPGTGENAGLRRWTFRRDFPDSRYPYSAGDSTLRCSADGGTLTQLEENGEAGWTVREVDVSHDPELVPSPPPDGLTVQEVGGWNQMGSPVVLLRDGSGAEKSRIEAPPGGFIETASLASRERRLLVGMHLPPPEDFRKGRGGFWYGSRWVLYKVESTGALRQIAEGEGRVNWTGGTPWFVAQRVRMSEAATVTVHRLETGEVLRKHGGPALSDSVSFAGFSPLGDCYALATVSPREVSGAQQGPLPDAGRPRLPEKGSATLHLIETATGNELWSGTLGETFVPYLALSGTTLFSPDGQRICACLSAPESDRRVHVLRKEDGRRERSIELAEARDKPTRRLRVPGGGFAVLGAKPPPRLHGFTREGRLILGEDGEVQFWNLETGACEARLKGNGHMTLDCRESADGARLFVLCIHSNSTCRLHVWDLRTDRQLLELPCGHPPLFAQRVRWEVRGDRLYVQQEDGYRVFDGTPTPP